MSICLIDCCPQGSSRLPVNMSSQSQDPLVQLWFAQGGPVLDVSADILIWGKQWTQIFARQEGITQVWIGQLDKNLSVHWIADGSSELLPDQFSYKALQDVIQQGMLFSFSNHEKLTSGALFPLSHRGQVIGLIGLLSNQIDYFKPDKIKWISTLTGIIADSLFQKESESKERRAEYSIFKLLQSNLDARDALPGVLEILTGVLQADAIIALRYDSLSRCFELLTAQGLETTILAKLNLYFEAGLAGDSFVFAGSQPVWINDLQSAAPTAQLISRLDQEGFRGFCGLPLLAHNDLLGALEIAWYLPRQWETWEKDFLGRVAEQIAFALERTYIQRDLRLTNAELMIKYNAMIEGLSRALELRDLETDGHTRRVSLLMMRLVEYMPIPADQWDAIRQGALLHDIGKIGIPDAILLKPGSLTTQERKVMQQHVVYGYNILAPIISARHTLDIVLYHHERWDGSGYPHHLKGEQIPSVARLFAVVDVFDALSSDRPYRAAWAHSQVLDYIKKQSGHQFDPQVVESFLQIAEKRG